MKFIVNKGQRIPHREEGYEGPQQWLTEGDIVEGPDWWMKEFAGRMSPIDEAGNVIDPRMAQLTAELAKTSLAHERVGMLRQLIEMNPGLESEFREALEAAAKGADEDQAKHAEQHAERAEQSKSDPVVRVVAGPGATAGPAVPAANRPVSPAPDDRTPPRPK